MARITAELLKAAGDYAAQQYNDQWLGIDVSDDKPTEPGTVIINYQGQLFEVWLLSRIQAAK